jgi:hypothetical protein
MLLVPASGTGAFFRIELIDKLDPNSEAYGQNYHTGKTLVGLEN